MKKTELHTSTALKAEIEYIKRQYSNTFFSEMFEAYGLPAFGETLDIIRNKGLSHIAQTDEERTDILNALDCNVLFTDDGKRVDFDEYWNLVISAYAHRPDAIHTMVGAGIRFTPIEAADYCMHLFDEAKTYSFNEEIIDIELDHDELHNIMLSALIEREKQTLLNCITDCAATLKPTTKRKL